MTNSSKLINAARQYDSVTANGATTHSTSTNFCLDLFFQAGASRQMPESSIITLFERARAENIDLAYKILFWSRDCRGGAGEKRFFQILGKHISTTYPNEWSQCSIFIPEYGYWKDFFKIEEPNEDLLNFFKHQLDESPNANLLAKWFPRKGKWFVAMHKYLKVSPKDFRKRLVEMTNVVETKMCRGEWNLIPYSQVPSYAMNMYRNAFGKHDATRFEQFNNAVLAGDATVNASVLFPHQLYQALKQGQNETAVEAQWKSLPNFMEGSKERIIPVCDVSGSMEGLPMDVSVALGLYIAERNEGIFKDAFLTFNTTPTMEFVQGTTLAQKMRSISSANWGGTTNLQATFDLVLRSAVRENLPEDEMPTKMLIISDMEFDQCERGWGHGHQTNLDAIRDKYKQAGYKMPDLIFWNVNGRLGNSPAKASNPGVGLVSGFSPAILTAILSGQGFTPVDLMMQAVGGERYAPIHIDERD